MKSKKALEAAVLALVGVAAPLFGAGDSDGTCGQSCCQPVMDTCCMEPECPCFCGDTKIAVRADLLYWESKLSGLEGAFGTTYAEQRDNHHGYIVTAYKERDQKPNFDWRAGVRVGVDFFRDQFGIEANWTHIYGKATHSKNDSHGNWRSKYDSVDVILGYKLYPCNTLYFKPYIGARGARIHQRLDSNLKSTVIREEVIDDVLQDVTTYSTIVVDQREEFTGVGPEVGVSGSWCLGYNFSIYGDVNFVTYFGNIDGKYNNTDTFTDTIFTNDWEKRRMYHCLELGSSIGLRWDHYSCFPKCLVHFSLKLGLEQRRLCDFSELGADGALSLAGGVFEAGVGIKF